MGGAKTNGCVEFLNLSGRLLSFPQKVLSRKNVPKFSDPSRGRHRSPTILPLINAKQKKKEGPGLTIHSREAASGISFIVPVDPSSENMNGAGNPEEGAFTQSHRGGG